MSADPRHLGRVSPQSRRDADTRRHRRRRRPRRYRSYRRRRRPPWVPRTVRAADDDDDVFPASASWDVAQSQDYSGVANTLGARVCPFVSVCVHIIILLQAWCVCPADFRLVRIGTYTLLFLLFHVLGPIPLKSVVARVKNKINFFPDKVKKKKFSRVFIKCFFFFQIREKIFLSRTVGVTLLPCHVPRRLLTAHSTPWIANAIRSAFRAK